MTLKNLSLALSVSILAISGWAGFGVLSRQDLIAGAELKIALPGNAWSDSIDQVAFAVIGDAGTGGRNQFRIASEMAETYRRHPFSLLLTTGDNVYFGDVVDRVREVVDKPYQPLFDAGVEFRPALGNHDVDDDDDDIPLTLAALRMPSRYYAFRRGPVDFFALDSNDMDSDQILWLTNALICSKNHWQVVYLHHPLYSSGMHGSDLELRAPLEAALVRGGVDIVFSGHDHNYERTLPQQGVTYVVTGGGGAHIRRVDSSAFTAVSEADLHFTFVKVVNNTMHVIALEDDGEIMDDFVLNPRAAQIPCLVQ